MNFKKLNKEYTAPQLSVIAFATSDIITGSPIGYDTEDNWLDDAFPIK